MPKEIAKMNNPDQLVTDETMFESVHHCAQLLKRQGLWNEAKEMTEKTFEAANPYEVLAITQEYLSRSIMR